MRPSTALSTLGVPVVRGASDVPDDNRPAQAEAQKALASTSSSKRHLESSVQLFVGSSPKVLSSSYRDTFVQPATSATRPSAEPAGEKGPPEDGARGDATADTAQPSASHELGRPPRAPPKAVASSTRRDNAGSTKAGAQTPVTRGHSGGPGSRTAERAPQNRPQNRPASAASARSLGAASAASSGWAFFRPPPTPSTPQSIDLRSVEAGVVPQAKPMVLVVDDPLASTREVLEMEIGRMGIEELREFRWTQLGGAGDKAPKPRPGRAADTRVL